MASMPFAPLASVPPSNGSEVLGASHTQPQRRKFRRSASATALGSLPSPCRFRRRNDTKDVDFGVDAALLRSPTGPTSPAVRPLRLGIQFCPPTLRVEYAEGPEAGARLRLHTVRLRSWWLREQPQDLVAMLRQHPKHAPFVHEVPRRALSDMLQRLQTEAAAAGYGSPEPPSAKLIPQMPASTGQQQPAAVWQPATPDRDGRSAPLPAAAHSRRQRQFLEPAAVALSSAFQAVADPSTSSSCLLVQPGVAAAKSDVNKARCCVWPSNAWATWSLGKGADVKPDRPSSEQLQELYESFRTSRGVSNIAESFGQLFHASFVATGSPPLAPSSVPLDTIAFAVGDHRRLARSLWARLAARREQQMRPLHGRHCVVVGAGPVGLRCALELRLLGAEVVVLEKRTEFDRVNRVLLWGWCGEDLKSWGAKVLEPPELSFGADPDFLHVGIAELQMLLLKPCLLLGVQLFFGTEYVGSMPEAHGPHNADPAWSVLVQHAQTDFASAFPGPVSPERFRGVDFIVGADGPRSRVAAAHGLEPREAAGFRRGAASLGLVANFTNLQSPAEKGRRSFSLARQFYGPLFEACERETGVALENVVCYVSQQMHYFVMTPTRRNLQDLGILATDVGSPGHNSSEERPPVRAADAAGLARVARAVAAFAWKPDEPALPTETLDALVGAPSLFDFSSTRRAACGLCMARGPVPSSALSEVDGSTGIATPRQEAQLLVGLCGDALIEPFWPEGLGIARGFLAALDLVSAVKVWAESDGDLDAAAMHFEACFRQLKSLSASTSAAVLRSDVQAYGLDPSTRYRTLATAVPGGPRQRASSLPAPRRHNHSES
mmetsp:Transcript_79284/g.157000  ORF Transcript_79284/g.157000 Transcript_79284/m.157000 type:complete len:834 (-) Transcript_79284:97-2598(-)